MTGTFYTLMARSFSAYADLCGEPQQDWAHLDSWFATREEAETAADALRADGYQVMIADWDSNEVYA